LAQAARATPVGRVTQDGGGWREEGRNLACAVAGGAIVGMPLLYTMEMWWHGLVLSELHLLLVLAGTLVVNFLFSLSSGFREAYSVPEALSEALTAVGVGVVFSVVVLALIGEIRPGVAPVEIAGKILLEAAAVSIGASFANSQVRERSRQAQDGSPGAGGAAPGSDDAENSPASRQLQADIKEAGAALAGSTVFALNIAPTEEVVMIATRLSRVQQLGLLAAGLVLCYLILFAAQLKTRPVHLDSLFQHPAAETLFCGAISIFVSAVLIVLLGERAALSDASVFVATVVTLGLPAMVGGAAGRLIV
jgi:putative integral membrane protein (TIGR02587 family)